MKINTALVGALISLASAHDGPQAGHPTLVGGRDFISSLKHRHHPHADAPALEERQNADGTCGPGVGKCGASQCCSPSGYCGVGSDYCNSPDCQYLYGPGELSSRIV